MQLVAATCDPNNQTQKWATVWVDGPPSPTFPAFSHVKTAASRNLCMAPNGPQGQVNVALVLRPRNGLDFRQYWFGG